MASCAAGKTSRVYGQYTELICKLMIRTWGYLFEANEKKNIKIHVNPAKFTSLLCGLCYIPLRMYAFCTFSDCLSPFYLVSPCDSMNTQFQWKAML